MELRANTHIDRGHVRLWNRWIERSWSAFMGTTTSLEDRAAHREWVGGRCAEFALTINSVNKCALDFGELDFAEENNRFGAVIVCRKMAPNLVVTIRTMAFHEAPVFYRTVSVYNAGDAAIELSDAVIDSLALAPADLNVSSLSIAPQESIEPLPLTEFTMLSVPFGGLYAGGFTGVDAKVESGAPSHLKVHWRGHSILRQGTSHTFPASIFVSFSGTVLAASTVLAPSLQHVSAMLKGTGC
jgi:hypothetical protein